MGHTQNLTVTLGVAEQISEHIMLIRETSLL